MAEHMIESKNSSVRTVLHINSYISTDAVVLYAFLSVYDVKTNSNASIPFCPRRFDRGTEEDDVVDFEEWDIISGVIYSPSIIFIGKLLSYARNLISQP